LSNKNEPTLSSVRQYHNNSDCKLPYGKHVATYMLGLFPIGQLIAIITKVLAHCPSSVVREQKGHFRVQTALYNTFCTRLYTYSLPLRSGMYKN